MFVQPDLIIEVAAADDGTYIVGSANPKKNPKPDDTAAALAFIHTALSPRDLVIELLGILEENIVSTDFDPDEIIAAVESYFDAAYAETKPSLETGSN